MIKLYWDKEEYYPFYTLDNKNHFSEEFLRRRKGSPLEFTDEEFADYERVMSEFDRWQDIIGKRVGEK